MKTRGEKQEMNKKFYKYTYHFILALEIFTRDYNDMYAGMHK